MKKTAAALSMLCTALLLRAGSPADELSAETRERFRDLILPKPAEEAWRAIPWRTTYWEAVTEGQRKEMPVFLWTMNGHPLACT